MSNTKERIIAVAIVIFADKGFYGASIDSIASQLSITKQALLHHFGSKEKLYGEVIQRLASELTQQLHEVKLKAPSATSCLQLFFDGLQTFTQNNTCATQLLLRELMDNRDRAPVSTTWYLKPFLQQLTELRMMQLGNGATPTAALADIYVLLGAINYFAVSAPTLISMFGDEHFEKLKTAHRQTLLRLLHTE